MMLQTEKREARTVEAIEDSDAGMCALHIGRPRPATGGGLVRFTFHPAISPDLRCTVAGKGLDNGLCTSRTPAETNSAKTVQAVKSLR